MKLREVNTKIIAYSTACIIVIVLILTMIFIAHFSDHRCADSNCPVCATMLQCVENINTSKPEANSLIADIVLVFASRIFAYYYNEPLRCNTLISQKVRLDN